MSPTRSPLPTGPEDLVVNTGPVIALGKIGAFDLIKELPIGQLAHGRRRRDRTNRDDLAQTVSDRRRRLIPVYDHPFLFVHRVSM